MRSLNKRASDVWNERNVKEAKKKNTTTCGGDDDEKEKRCRWEPTSALNWIPNRLRCGTCCAIVRVISHLVRYGATQMASRENKEWMNARAALGFCVKLL